MVVSCSAVLAGEQQISSESTTIGDAKVHYLAAWPVDGLPVLAIWDENGHAIILAHADLLAKNIPDASIVIIPDAGHALYMDDAKTFHEELIRFIEKLGPVSAKVDKSHE